LSPWSSSLELGFRHRHKLPRLPTVRPVKLLSATTGITSMALLGASTIVRIIKESSSSVTQVRLSVRQDIETETPPDKNQDTGADTYSTPTLVLS